jgi:2-succinyl-5-enolpyruvyl-6-hydroxy-3-cyclohexene-1-carboxylate synthase
MSVATAANPTYAFCAAFFEELARSGVEHVCISPGSRSTPLTLAALEEPKLRAWSHLDERAAAFFALGLAKVSRRPVALVATSGTAPANYFPAVIEAHYARVPLLVLSADRPAELKEWGAGQTIDQVKLYGSHVRWFSELPIPTAGADALHYVRALACRAVAEADAEPPGPVHLNWPLREPLAPVSDSQRPGSGWGAESATAQAGRLREDCSSGEWGAPRPYVIASRAPSLASPEQIRSLVEKILANPQGVIACGPQDTDPEFPRAVVRLAELAGWPILADPTSQLRSGHHAESQAGFEPGPILAHSDLILRGTDFSDRHAPEMVLRFGASPVSRSFRLWIEAHSPRDIVLVDSTDSWNDPSHLISERIVADPTSLCRGVVATLEQRDMKPRRSPWFESFLEAESVARGVLESRVDNEPVLYEPRATREVCRALPDGGLLYVSNSMPVRDLDAFMPISTRRVRVLCNRGANGIDGMISSALGAEAAAEGPVVLLTGDLAFLHDLGGLLAAHRYRLGMTVVILNNDGGGIFSHLPVASLAEPEAFEEFFATPHGLDFEAVGRLYDTTYLRVETWDELRGALEKGQAEGRVSIIEIPIDRDANLEHFRELVSEVARSIDEASSARGTHDPLALGGTT